MRIGLVGTDSSHADQFLRFFNVESRHPGMRIATIWGPDAAPERTAELLALSAGVVAAADLDDLIGRSDAVIVGDRHGDLHAAHALPCLEAGRPVFVDKPLACSLSDAQAIVQTSLRTGTPLASGSALRWQRDTETLKRHLAGGRGAGRAACLRHLVPRERIWRADLLRHPRDRTGDRTARPRLARSAAHAGVSRRPGAVMSAITRRRWPSTPLDSSGSSAFGVAVSAGGTAFEQPVALPDDYMLPVVDRIAKMFRTGVRADERRNAAGPDPDDVGDGGKLTRLQALSFPASRSEMSTAQTWATPSGDQSVK